MTEPSKIDFSHIDQPEILRCLFHPRAELGASGAGGPIQDFLIPVAAEVVVGGRFHIAGESMPTILFFHGNGEIAADYDEMGPLYNNMRINFLVVDYRGYGRSTGIPTFTSMMRDCHTIYQYIIAWLDEHKFSRQVVSMGRSLGSAPALELADHYHHQVKGLIVESGFAYFGALLNLFGMDAKSMGIPEDGGFRHIDKVQGYDKPTLIIHAEKDHLIPFSHGQTLYDSSGASDKVLLKIPEADHNSIFQRGLSRYMSAVKILVDKTVQ